ncbi:MAG: hypothetical protein J4N74_10185, partial [Chloroflexi bacterium]|nr:hypothetical protein [Chloroflexota bacterium]
GAWSNRVDDAPQSIYRLTDRGRVLTQQIVQREFRFPSDLNPLPIVAISALGCAAWWLFGRLDTRSACARSVPACLFERAR